MEEEEESWSVLPPTEKKFESDRSSSRGGLLDLLDSVRSNSFKVLFVERANRLPVDEI